MNRRRRRVIWACGGAFLGLAGCLGGTDGSPEQDTVSDGNAGASNRNTTPDDPATRDSPTEPNTSEPTSPSPTTPSEQPADRETPGAPDRVEWHVRTEARPERPTVVDGTSYLGTGELFSDQPACEILAVDPDGSVRWRKQPGQEVATVAAVNDGVVYAVTGDSNFVAGSNFQVHAFDAETGERRWHVTPGLSYKIFEVLGVGEDAVFVGTSDDALGGGGEQVFGLERRGGERLWSEEVGDVMAGTVTNGTVATETVGGVSAFAAADGAARWTYEYDRHRGIAPAAFEGLVLVGEKDLHALDAVEGTERWTFGDEYVNSWQVSGGTVYVGGSVVAALTPSGESTWTYRKGGILSDAAITEDALFGASQGSLFSLARVDGDERWRTDVDTEFASPGGVAGGYLAFGTQEGNVVVVDAGSGKETWAWRSQRELTRPAVADGNFVVGSAGGGLWALRP